MIVKQKLQEDKQAVKFSDLGFGACFEFQGRLLIKLLANNFVEQAAVDLETGQLWTEVRDDDPIVSVDAHVEWQYFRIKKEIPAEVG